MDRHRPHRRRDRRRRHQHPRRLVRRRGLNLDRYPSQQKEERGVTFYHDSVLGKKNWVRSLVVLVLVLVWVWMWVRVIGAAA
jgi:hypothetical protein